MSTAWIDFRALRAQVRMIDVLHHYRIDAKVRGEQATALCPFAGHPVRTDGQKRTASLSINLTKGIFKCFGCQATGNCIDFVIRCEGLDPSNPQHVRRAALKLAEWFGVKCDPRSMPKRGTIARGDARKVADATPQRAKAMVSSPVEAAGENPSPAEVTASVASRSDDAVKSADAVKIVVNAPLPFRLEKLDPTHPYLADRGFSAETIATFGLGYCSRGMLKDRIAIPLHDFGGELVGYGGRIVDDHRIGDDCPKYLFPGAREQEGVRHEFHKNLLLYNAHRLGVPIDTLVVVEGFAAVWWLTQCGHPNVVALMGNSCSDAQANLIARLVRETGKIIALPDGDEAGSRCAVSLFQQVRGPQCIRWGRLRNGMQPTDLAADELDPLLG